MGEGGTTPCGKFRGQFEASAERRRKKVEHWKERLLEMLEARLVERVLSGDRGEALLRDLAVAVAERKKDPFSAVSEILARGGTS